VTPALVT